MTLESTPMPPLSDSARIHIVLVEDDENVLAALSSAIASTPDMKLVHTAGTRAQALALLALAPADVLLVDLGLPDGSGIDVISAAQQAWPSCAIMVSTVFGDELNVIRSIEAGASGYLLKDSAPYAMMDEIRSLNAGGSPISPLIARQMLVRFRQDSKPLAAPAQPAAPSPASAPATLSPREHQVLELITKGFTYDEVAGLMQVSRYTVMTFVRRVYAKLEVKSKAEAIYEARLQGLLEP